MIINRQQSVLNGWRKRRAKRLGNLTMLLDRRLHHPDQRDLWPFSLQNVSQQSRLRVLTNKMLSKNSVPLTCQRPQKLFLTKKMLSWYSDKTFFSCRKVFFPSKLRDFSNWKKKSWATLQIWNSESHRESVKIHCFRFRVQEKKKKCFVPI